jgi:DNA invertase Pin-like site-specific DNA recombinase
LRWATTAENQAEKVVHGRSLRGSKNPNSKYDEEVVSAVRGLRKCGLVQREIAEIVGTTRGTVRDILTGKSWAWLEM